MNKAVYIIPDDGGTPVFYQAVEVDEDYEFPLPDDAVLYDIVDQTRVKVVGAVESMRQVVIEDHVNRKRIITMEVIVKDQLSMEAMVDEKFGGSELISLLRDMNNALLLATGNNALSEEQFRAMLLNRLHP